MNPAFTERARQAVTGAWTMYSSIDLLDRGEVSEELLFDPAGLKVSVDSTQEAERRTVSGVNVYDALKYLPLTPTSKINPFGPEIRIWSGIRFPDGSVDRWAIFTGAIEDPVAKDDNDDIVLSFDAKGRGQQVSDRRLSESLDIAANTPAVDAIVAVVSEVYPGLEWQITDLPNTPRVSAMQIDELADAMATAQDIAKAAGAEVFFNGMGQPVIRPIPDYDANSVAWNFVEGATATVLGVDQQLTAKESYNHAIVQGAAIDGRPPIRRDAYDDDENSPTFWRPGVTGGFGEHVTKLSSDLITTDQQAQDAAVALVNRKKGAVTNLNFTTSPITALDEGDSVSIQRGRLGLASGFVLVKFDIPLEESGTMSPSTRSRRL